MEQLNEAKSEINEFEYLNYKVNCDLNNNSYVDIKERIKSYWDKRSENFAKLKNQELHAEIADLWISEIYKYIPSDKKLKILDIGTGSGFFAILLAKYGHIVTGVDITPAMINEAKNQALKENLNVDFMLMDAENLDFSDETFDVVISRNLTWTLPDASKAYSEWIRVLKKGGVLLNFDADYGSESSSDFSKLPTNHVHKQIGQSMLMECDNIKSKLEISNKLRPAWDISTLINYKVKEIHVDMSVSERIYLRKDDQYNPTKLFLICCLK